MYGVVYGVVLVVYYSLSLSLSLSPLPHMHTHATHTHTTHTSMWFEGFRRAAVYSAAYGGDFRPAMEAQTGTVVAVLAAAIGLASLSPRPLLATVATGFLGTRVATVLTGQVRVYMIFSIATYVHHTPLNYGCVHTET